MHVGTGVTGGQDESRVAGLGKLLLLIQYLDTSKKSAAGKFVKSSVIWSKIVPYFRLPWQSHMIVCHFTEELKCPKRANRIWSSLLMVVLACSYMSMPAIHGSCWKKVLPRSHLIWLRKLSTAESFLLQGVHQIHFYIERGFFSRTGDRRKRNQREHCT